MLFEENKNPFKEFCEWQKVPHRVKPMTKDEHVCPTCTRHYVGNYCPQCGQSSKIGRYSFKNAFLLFIDVWGLGNRGMFRALRDLFLRPGYMIRDYLRGMQMAYFPPFKMLFLICTLSLIIETGLNVKGINRYQQYMDEEKVHTEKLQAETKTDMTLSTESKEISIAAYQMIYKIEDIIRQNPQLAVLVYLLLLSGPLYIMFRHSPAIPDLHFSECFVAMVYIANMLLICIIIPSLLCFSFKAESYFDLIVLLLAIIPIKQLSGYSYWSTIWRIIVAFIPFTIILIAIYLIICLVYFL
ncbi:MAG: DUF3667 domain-containing protein [Muribaculaceae bacterium]|nr:DUF3667 domain-containing protein [Muribaculaceae bacterium]